MKYVGYYNGEIGPYEEMTIPMSDRSIYFGDGCYDATTFCNATTGFIVESLGWQNFFVFCTILAVPGMLLLLKVAPFRENKES